jgi:hypothetical protein
MKRTNGAAAVGLSAWLATVARTGDPSLALVAAAEAVAADPWDVIALGGLLARARPTVADRDFGLTATLREVDGPGVVRVERGQTYPARDVERRKARGAFDTPVTLARRVAAAAVAAAAHTHTGLDPACGSGAFLVAMREAGVTEVFGTDTDPVVLEVARIACPTARLACGDAFVEGPLVDVVAANPPFVPPELQDKALRAALRALFPWLHGRFDLVVPFAAAAVARAVPGGGIGLVLPAPLLSQPYGAALRRRWVESHRITVVEAPVAFDGADVHVALVAMQAGRGPAALPGGAAAAEVLELPGVPLDPDREAGDAALIGRIRAGSVALGQLCVVDTGVVGHGRDGGKGRLLHDGPGPGRVPYADARDFFAGRTRWLSYDPARMHRAKSLALFAAPKVVVQRLRGSGPVRAAVDLGGTVVGHTCLVVVPRDARIDAEQVLTLLTSDVIAGLLRIERGPRLDLYPHDVAEVPVPVRWLASPELPLGEAFGLSATDVGRLVRRAGAAARRPA